MMVHQVQQTNIKKSLSLSLSLSLYIYIYIFIDTHTPWPWLQWRIGCSQWSWHLGEACSSHDFLPQHYNGWLHLSPLARRSNTSLGIFLQWHIWIYSCGCCWQWVDFCLGQFFRIGFELLADLGKIGVLFVWVA